MNPRKSKTNLQRRQAHRSVTQHRHEIGELLILGNPRRNRDNRRCLQGVTGHICRVRSSSPSPNYPPALSSLRALALVVGPMEIHLELNSAALALTVVVSGVHGLKGASNLTANETQAAHVVFNRLQFKDLAWPFALLLAFPATNVLFQWYSSERALGLKSIFSTYMAFYVGLGISIMLYRLSPLHPLYAFPGPRLSRISKLWGVWISWKGHQHVVLKSLHDKYGPFVRTGRSYLHFRMR